QMQDRDSSGAQRLNVMNDRKGQQEDEDRQSAQADENYVYGAMHTLSCAAVTAGGQMLFVIGAHLRRDAGNVITPARKYVPDDSIGASAHRSGPHSLPTPCNARP